MIRTIYVWSILVNIGCLMGNLVFFLHTLRDEMFFSQFLNQSCLYKIYYHTYMHKWGAGAAKKVWYILHVNLKQIMKSLHFLVEWGGINQVLIYPYKKWGFESSSILTFAP